MRTNKNRTLFLGVAATLALLLGLGFNKSNFFRPALAQHLNAVAKATYVTAADVSATASRGPEMDQPIRVVDAGQYNVGVYITRRLQEADQGCTIEHDTVALDDVTEILRVIEDSGTLVTGGTLKNRKQMAANDPDLPTLGPGTGRTHIETGEHPT